jgi:hypothetical protein
MASDSPVALCHLLPYGRRAAPSKGDNGALEGKTDDYSPPAKDYGVTSGQRGRSPPSPSVLCGHPRCPNTISGTASPSPTLWGTGQQDAATPAAVRPAASRQSHPRANVWMTTKRATPTPPPSKPPLDVYRARHDARQMQDSPGRSSTPQRCTPLKASMPLIRVLVINDNHYRLTFLFEL